MASDSSIHATLDRRHFIKGVRSTVAGASLTSTTQVYRTLSQKNAQSIALVEVSCILPPETRMYLPKVLATIALRESIEPGFLPGL